MEDTKIQKEALADGTEDLVVEEVGKPTIEEAPKVEEKKEEKPTTNEEKVEKTYTEAQVAEIKKNAIAEGMRKAGKNNGNEAVNEEINALKAELSAFKNAKILTDLGISDQKQADCIALIKGEGKEVTPETLKEVAMAHPEWKKQEQTNGVESLGQTASEKDAQEVAKHKADQERWAKAFKSHFR